MLHNTWLANWITVFLVTAAAAAAVPECTRQQRYTAAATGYPSWAPKFPASAVVEYTSTGTAVIHTHLSAAAEARSEVLYRKYRSTFCADPSCCAPTAILVLSSSCVRGATEIWMAQGSSPQQQEPGVRKETATGSADPRHSHETQAERIVARTISSPPYMMNTKE